MKPIRTPLSRTVDLGPAGTKIAPLPSWREPSEPGLGAPVVVLSVWQPTPEEREAIANGANLVLGVWSDPIPPVVIEVRSGEEFEPIRGRIVNDEPITALLGVVEDGHA